ncbi:hypothetical protein HDV63DRAFT_383311 [Trichoderma sp. SZMC 28014]
MGGGCMELLSVFGAVVLILGSYSCLKRGRLSCHKRSKYMHTYEAVISPTSRDGAIFSTQRVSRKIKMPEGPRHLAQYRQQNRQGGGL